MHGAGLAAKDAGVNDDKALMCIMYNAATWAGNGACATFDTIIDTVKGKEGEYFGQNASLNDLLEYSARAKWFWWRKYTVSCFFRIAE